MKISICGKGGSGKSVIAALLAMGLKARGYRVEGRELRGEMAAKEMGEVIDHWMAS